jgi:Syntaxin-like protein
MGAQASTLTKRSNWKKLHPHALALRVLADPHHRLLLPTFVLLSTFYIMSFNDDLEAQQASYPDPVIASPEFGRLTNSISEKIFNITSNVATVHRYIGLLGTSRDTPKMRSLLMETLKNTKTTSKDAVPEIRALSRWDPVEIGPSGKYEQRKLTGDFQNAVIDFQNAQKLALEKQSDYLNDVKAPVEENKIDEEETVGQRLQLQQGTQILLDSDIDFNVSLIEEREVEIQMIQDGIIDLNEIFRDLATIIVEQGSTIGTIPKASRLFRYHRTECFGAARPVARSSQGVNCCQHISEKRTQTRLLANADTLYPSYRRSPRCNSYFETDDRC